MSQFAHNLQPFARTTSERVAFSLALSLLVAIKKFGDKN